MEFEWDSTKAISNIRKHGVSFEEAATVFSGPVRIKDDDFHGETENRYIAVGISDRGRRLFVSHALREGKLRIIMARVVTNKEWKRYVEDNAQ